MGAAGRAQEKALEAVEQEDAEEEGHEEEHELVVEQPLLAVGVGRVRLYPGVVGAERNQHEAASEFSKICLVGAPSTDKITNFKMRTEHNRKFLGCTKHPKNTFAAVFH